MLLTEAKISPAILESPDNWIPVTQYNNFQEMAISATQDEFFGLHIGERAATGSWSALGYIMMNCRTLGEAFQRTKPYKDIMGGMLEITGDRESDQILIIVRNRFNTPRQSHHCYDTILASFITIMRILTNNQISLTEVRLGISVPDDVKEYQRIFNCPLLFEQEKTALVFHQKILDLPIICANPELLKVFEKRAENLIKTINKEKLYSRQVSQLLINKIPVSIPSIGDIAFEMAMSTRNLQLKLREEETTFRQIMRDIRKELSINYIKEGIYSITEISYLLGFSEPSVFYRVFKTWFGVPPRQFRSQL